MQAVRLTVPTSRNGLILAEEPTPEVGRRDVLLRIRAASLNFRDTFILKGKYPGPLKAGCIPLSDGAGEVVAVGRDVHRVKIGERVTANCQPHWIGGPRRLEYRQNALGITADGMLAEFAVFDENAIVPIPDYLTFAEAAALPCAAVSAWSALTFGEPLTPGQTVLVQGTGGVALFALQIAKMFGARVVAITSSTTKVDRLKELGADAVVNYNETPKWSEAILEFTGGVGVDKVVEIGGEATIEQSAASTRIGGEIGLVGYVTGLGGGLPPIAIMARGLHLQGISIGPRAHLEALLTAMAVARMRPVIDSVFSFENYKAAYDHLESGRQIGKVVIEVGR